ncbi:MAG: hypothetical protein RMK97_03330 [Sutterellaceae bacterium]|nr:hypothetical protein [Burkholderiaceae bacterium]MCX7901068.1 hypothetical protein [Burkholderiaceae bacterium]MDW8429524.1 hypothetical protein [Sutterellaceae bacterium]
MSLRFHRLRVAALRRKTRAAVSVQFDALPALAQDLPVPAG